MEMTVNMPMVFSCEMKECAYNRDGSCHAMAITVGGPGDHVCDTMMCNPSHVHRIEEAGVGACKVTECLHNEDFCCIAKNISIVNENGQANCAMYES